LGCDGNESLTSDTPWRRTHLDVTTRIAALFHVHVATDAISAASFARAKAIRYGTALRLLHEARAALDPLASTRRGATTQVLGRESAANRAFVFLDVRGGALRARVVPRARRGPPPESADASLWLGRLRAWLADVYRGVTRRWLPHYLDEYAARFGRIAARFSHDG
jgi:hypothetical protein